MSVDSILQLPEDILTLCFAYLPGEEHTNINATCKRFGSLSFTHQFYQLHLVVHGQAATIQKFALAYLNNPNFDSLFKEKLYGSSSNSTLRKKPQDAVIRLSSLPGDLHKQLAGAIWKANGFHISVKTELNVARGLPWYAQLQKVAKLVGDFSNNPQVSINYEELDASFKAILEGTSLDKELIKKSSRKKAVPQAKKQRTSDLIVRDIATFLKALPMVEVGKWPHLCAVRLHSYGLEKWQAWKKPEFTPYVKLSLEDTRLAVSKNRSAIKTLVTEHSDDKELALIVAKKSPASLRLLSERLQKDKDVLAAVHPINEKDEDTFATTIKLEQTEDEISFAGSDNETKIDIITSEKPSKLLYPKN